MFVEELVLPQDWFKVKIGVRENLNLFVNLKQQLFSLTPVCSLSQLRYVFVSFHTKCHFIISFFLEKKFFLGTLQDCA